MTILATAQIKIECDGGGGGGDTGGPGGCAKVTTAIDGDYIALRMGENIAGQSTIYVFGVDDEGIHRPLVWDPPSYTERHIEVIEGVATGENSRGSIRFFVETKYAPFNVLNTGWRLEVGLKGQPRSIEGVANGSKEPNGVWVSSSVIPNDYAGREISYKVAVHYETHFFRMTGALPYDNFIFIGTSLSCETEFSRETDGTGEDEESVEPDNTEDPWSEEEAAEEAAHGPCAREPVVGDMWWSSSSTIDVKIYDYADIDAWSGLWNAQDIVYVRGGGQESKQEEKTITYTPVDKTVYIETEFPVENYNYGTINVHQPDAENPYAGNRYTRQGTEHYGYIKDSLYSNDEAVINYNVTYWARYSIFTIRAGDNPEGILSYRTSTDMCQRFVPLNFSSLAGGGVSGGGTTDLNLQILDKETNEPIVNASVYIAGPYRQGEDAPAAAGDSSGYDARSYRTDDEGKISLQNKVHGVYRLSITASDQGYISSRDDNLDNDEITI
jgi:hypothetical protein